MRNSLGLFAFSVSAFAILASGISASAGDFMVDKDHSHVGFKVRHLVSRVMGEFKDYQGTFSFDPKKVSDSKVSFTIKTASVNTDNEKRDTHLRSADFFDVQRYPEMTFESKKVTLVGKNKYKVEGDFTLHGEKKPVPFEVEYLGETKDPWGNQRAGFTATAQIDRKKFGLTWNKALEAGGLMVGDDVSIELQIEAVEKKTDSAKKM